MSHEEHFSIDVPEVLPHERVYSIQIGYKMFKLSGASLSSDSPSYFTEYFSRKDAERHARCAAAAAESESKTKSLSVSSEQSDINAGNKYASAYEEKDVLFIDRSPEVFELIYNHLQGYSITIKDENQYTMLFADAMYYNLPRLRYFLKHSDYYYACIGGKSFKIPKNLLTANGNSMNYFEITIAALYADLEYIYMQKKPIRPPPQSPPYVPRSPELFDDLLALLNGAELTLDDRKRNSLIKECRFYHLLNLEQTLLKCEIKYDPYYKLEVIIMYLKDLTSKGVTLRRKTEENAIESQMPTTNATACATSQSMSDIFPDCKKQKVENWRIFTYSRPYLDETPRDLIFQVDTMDCLLYFNKRQKVIHVNLRSETARRFTSVFNTPLRDLNIYLDDYRDPQRVEGLIIPCCIFVTDLTVNGIRCTNICSLIDENTIAEKIPDFTTASGSHSCVPGLKLVLLKSMWRFAIKNEDLVLVCIRADATTCINEFHHSIDFL